MTRKHFQEWLLKEMEKRGWSQGELARKAGISQGAVSHVLSGLRAPGPDFCRAIARALGYPQEFVFRKAGLIDDPQPQSPLVRLLLFYFEQLSPEEQEIVLAQVRALSERREERRKASHFSKGTSEVAP